MARVVTSQYSRILASGDTLRAGIEYKIGDRLEEDQPHRTFAERYYDAHPKLNKILEPLRQLCLRKE